MLQATREDLGGYRGQEIGVGSVDLAHLMLAYQRCRPDVEEQIPGGMGELPENLLERRSVTLSGAKDRETRTLQQGHDKTQRLPSREWALKDLRMRGDFQEFVEDTLGQKPCLR